ncbi:MAG: cytochrome b/b6 domain-containing protein, partial [Anaerolineae bacterium]|nr:cytochrome b/b6 domain-containing protein [Anaerolineae bacterium]
AGTGIVEQVGRNWRWLPDAFNEDGSVREDLILVQDPADQNCGQCHGVVHSDAQTPLTLTIGDLSQWNTLTTGQVFSPQRVSNSGLNVADKTELSRSFDVHAERVVSCVDCHYALNNPVFETEAAITRPDHLSFDPRRMDFGEYLYRPLHEFANTGAETVTNFGSSERTCASCHEAQSTHTWLPYSERHINALACETCHVPELYGTAAESVNWTTLRMDGQPVITYRGVEQEDGNALLTGFTPVLLPAETSDGVKLAPFNLVSAWYWVYGEPARPVSVEDLRAVWLTESGYAPEIIANFDANADRMLDESELALDSEVKVALVAGRLAARGLENPRVAGEVQPYAIHHNVTQGEWATRECRTCHGDESRVNAPMLLASFMPGGADPTFIGDDGAMSGSVTRDDAGALYYQPASNILPVNLYILGHDAVGWIDLLGMLLFLGVFAGVIVHGGLRYLAARRAVVHQTGPVRQVYMYGIYERQWHWLQTIAIFGLLFTGLVIHRPNQFSLFDFRVVVLVHNALAALLVINAALSLFYHLVSGEIRQYLPRPYGFFDQMIVQAKFYLGGIFRSEAHPFDKTPERKLNPLQQMTYFGILNVLLPLQVITGALMWGAQRLPGLTEQLGGLPFLAPFHTLIAWLFASFIVMHVYLTTTGHTPMANIKAMMLGWDEVEVIDEVGSQPSIKGEGMTS